jgi:hypothetical protein
VASEAGFVTAWTLLDCRVKPGNDDGENRSRGASLRPSFANHHAKKDSPPESRMIRKAAAGLRPDHARRKGRRSAERRMPTIAAQHQQALPLIDARVRLRAIAGRARLPALHRGSDRNCDIPAQLQAMFPGTRASARCGKVDTGIPKKITHG